MIRSLLALAALLAQSAPDAPPSTVLVPGGRTRIGIDVKDVERMIENDPNAAPFASALIAETPHQDLGIESFWMMVTEVTQEQYGEYVRATGAAPLESWCEPAIAAAAREFALAEQARVDAARETGSALPERTTFDRRAWFQANAQHLEWSIPPGDRLLPAVFVAYDAARGYARWAGMRLPSEYEYERAVRGDSAQLYPWGNEWDNDKFAATSLLKKKGGTWPVGSFPAGRSKQGVFDLAGNAWEWTSSPYVPFPGYQQKIFELGYGAQKHPVNAVADWDANQRVVVGGSFQTSNLMARATVRRGAVRDQMTGALGFRCAASLRPGADMAQNVVDDFDPQLRPRVDGAIVEYAPEMALCVDAWATLPPPARADWTPPEHYAVIAAYRYVVFAPVAQVPAADIGAFEKRSLEEPVQLGLLSANVPMVEPALVPGTYRVAYRARGARRLGESRVNAVEPAAEAPLEDVLHLDTRVDNLIISDLRGTPLVAVPLHVDYGLEREGEASSAEEPVTQAPADGGSPDTHAPASVGGETAPRVRSVRFDVALPCRTTKKDFLFRLDLRVAGGDPELVWRR